VAKLPPLTVLVAALPNGAIAIGVEAASVASTQDTTPRINRTGMGTTALAQQPIQHLSRLTVFLPILPMPQLRVKILIDLISYV
jgi:hypothetical protein